MKSTSVLLVGVFGTACFGCFGGGPVPADKLSRTSAAIHAAEVVGADKNAEGSRHLRAAREQLKEGRKLIIEGDQEAASWMLLRAEADAELALNVTRETVAVTDAEKTRDEIRNLRMSMKGGN